MPSASGSYNRLAARVEDTHGFQDLLNALQVKLFVFCFIDISAILL